MPDSEHDSLSDNHEPNISTPATHVDAVVENVSVVTLLCLCVIFHLFSLFSIVVCSSAGICNGDSGIRSIITIGLLVP